MGTPARGYKWRDAWPGNALATTHGGYSIKVFGPAAEVERDRLLAVIQAEGVEYLQRASFTFALEGLAEALGRVAVVRAHLAEHHGDDRDCDRDCDKALDRFERLVDRRLDACGLTPSSRARIEQALSSAVHDQADVVAQFARAARQRSQDARTQTNGSRDGDDDQ